MKLATLIIASFLLSLPMFSQEKIKNPSEETTTYYLIRHAEKDRSDKTNRNPHLNEAGVKRAEQWSKILEHVKFDDIYSTDYHRTKETASPTAKKNNLELKTYDPRSLANETFMRDTKGKTVLVVGHSNTTPMFANGILGEDKYDQMDDLNNGNLYIITIVNGVKTAQLLVFN